MDYIVQSLGKLQLDQHMSEIKYEIIFIEEQYNSVVNYNIEAAVTRLKNRIRGNSHVAEFNKLCKYVKQEHHYI